jgi:hypothetical protein
MQERDERMMQILQTAIKVTTIQGIPSEDARAHVMRGLRGMHAHFLSVHAYRDAWNTNALLRMLDTGRTVNETRMELKARIGKTPTTNRGVGFTLAVSLSGGHDV